jgi:hypothetical protein
MTACRGRIVSATRPLFITGTARSGTSMTAGVMKTLGLTFGQTVPGGISNPKGFFEHEGVRDHVLKPALVKAGGARSGQGTWPDPGKVDPDALRRGVHRHLKGANCYKDAKICLIWDSWARAFPHSGYVIVRRDLDDLAQSCLHTKFMRLHRTADGWKQWAQVFIDRCEELKQRVDFIEVWPDGTSDVFKPLAEFAGLEWNQEAVDEFVDPTLWNRHIR